MKIYNGDVELMYLKLSELPLKGKRNRMRSRFCGILKNHFTEVIQKERQVIIEEHAEKDSKGEIVYLDENKDKIKIKEESQFQIQKDFEELLLETLTIENNESNKEMLLTVADIILDDDCEIVVEGQFLEIFEIWCNELELVKSSYSN